MGEKEEKEQEVVARVLSRFKPKEVRRRETTNQWRRRTNQQDTTNKDLLRWVNLLTNQASSSSTSTQKQQNSPSFISLVPPPPPPKSSKILPLLTNLQQYKDSSQEAKPETEMIMNKSFPFTMADHKTTSNESSNRFKSSFSNNGRYNFVGGCSVNTNSLAPAVQIRSVIPVFSSPPAKPNSNPNQINDSKSVNRCSVQKSPGLGGQEKSLSSEIKNLKF